ncbi:MAG TPA: glycosyltransferase family A protein [Actinomycetaceae bacterium]|nr:glycosyltransferase family A protein [Actinomycetaceae bacterium]
MTADLPKVAIVVRTRNRSQFLRRALADIGKQTFTDYSVTIVNDAGNPAIVDSVVEDSPPFVRERTTVLHRTESTGMEAATNAGIWASDSEYCCVHDDDDLWEPQFLERTAGFLDSHPDTAMVAVRILIRYEREVEGEFVETGRVPFWGELQAITIQDLLAVNRIVPIGILYRRSLHSEVGMYDESLPAVGDWEFNLRVASIHEIELIDEPLALWCQRPGASGSSANSVLGKAKEHARYDQQARASAIRADLTAGSRIGPYLYQADLARTSLDRADERAEQVLGEIRSLHARIDDLERYIAERTNPLHMTRRAFSRLRNRRGDLP